MEPFTILVVDNEPDVLRFMRQLLEGSGYAVLTAPGGEQALLTLERRPEPPDLAILDLIMPGMDGFGLAEQITARWPGVPIIFVSGSREPQAQVQAIRRFAEDYVTKPFDSETLLARIERVLRRASPPEEPKAAGAARISLTVRQLQVLDLLAKGQTDQQIATRLHIAAPTVQFHTAGIYRKLKAHNRAEAVARAHRLGILTSRG